MNNVNNLKGKVAVITGASSGIGAASAEALVEAGASVVLLARREARLNDVIDKLGADNAAALVADVNDPNIAADMLTEAVSIFGRCDIVLNNAASFLVGPIEKLDSESVSEIAKTNVEAAYRVAYEAAKFFKHQGSGDIINLSSISGTKVARPGIGWYAGTKHAIEALTESLRMEFAGSGVRVCCIEPGMTNTEIFPEPITSIPTPLEPEDIAQAIVYVLSMPRRVIIPRLMILPSSQAI